MSKCHGNDDEALIRKIKEQLNAAENCMIVKRHEAGRLIKEALQRLKRLPLDSYPGAHPVDRLASALQLVKSDMYEIVRVATYWDRAELDQLLALRSAKGRSLSWLHFRYAMRLPKAACTKMLKAAALSGQSAVAMLQTITRTTPPSGGGREGRSGRRPAGFADSVASVRHLTKAVAAIIRRESLYTDALNELRNGDNRSGLVQKAAALETQLTDLQNLLTQWRVEIDAALAKKRRLTSCV